MLALVAKKKLRASARSFGFPAARAFFSYSSRSAVRRLSTCAFPAAIRLAISRVLRCVPVERKRRDASLLFGAPVDVAGAVALGPECFAASLAFSRRWAIRSIMMFVIVALAGLFQLPPRLSRYWLAAGTDIKTNSSSMSHPLCKPAFVLLILSSPFFRGRARHIGPRRSKLQILWMLAVALRRDRTESKLIHQRITDVP